VWDIPRGSHPANIRLLLMRRRPCMRLGSHASSPPLVGQANPCWHPRFALLSRRFPTAIRLAYTCRCLLKRIFTHAADDVGPTTSSAPRTASRSSCSQDIVRVSYYSRLKRGRQGEGISFGTLGEIEQALEPGVTLTQIKAASADDKEDAMVYRVQTTSGRGSCRNSAAAPQPQLRPRSTGC